MSKLQNGGPHKTVSKDSSAAIESSIDLKRGKKRKRKSAAVNNEENGVVIKKGTGKLMKFDASDQEDENPLKGEQKEKESEAPRLPKPKKDERPQAPRAELSTTASTHQVEADSYNPEPFHKPVMSSAAPKQVKPRAEKRPERKNGGRSTQPGGLRSPHGWQPHVSGALLKKRDELQPVRMALPIWPQAEPIRHALRRNNVLVLTGETGSGKSTQVPQFLASEPWCTKTIAITQPRRVAAISLARRVADEMGSLFGSQSPAARVGYSVRFDNATGPNTKIKFLTEGMLLQEMLRDPSMSQYSAVIVDEVHERSVNVDLILGFLRNLVSDMARDGKKRKAPLKVVVMSATADVKGLVRFFADGLPSPSGSANGTLDVPSTQNKAEPNPLATDQISTCFVEGRQYPVKTIYLPQPTLDWTESSLKLIFQIHYKEPLPGDILVFLTGQEVIEGLEKLVNDYAEGMDKEIPKVRLPHIAHLKTLGVFSRRLRFFVAMAKMGGLAKGMSTCLRVSLACQFLLARSPNWPSTDRME